MIMVPISVGELVDKITILKIKIDRVGDDDKRANIKREYDILVPLLLECEYIMLSSQIDRLTAVNESLWDTMDKLTTQFDPYEPQDSGHWVNDLLGANEERAAIKREINELTNSEIIEEKQYG